MEINHNWNTFVLSCGKQRKADWLSFFASFDLQKDEEVLIEVYWALVWKHLDHRPILLSFSLEDLGSLPVLRYLSNSSSRYLFEKCICARWFCLVCFASIILSKQIRFLRERGSTCLWSLNRRVVGVCSVLIGYRVDSPQNRRSKSQNFPKYAADELNFLSRPIEISEHRPPQAIFMILFFNTTVPLNY